MQFETTLIEQHLVQFIQISEHVQILSKQNYDLFVFQTVKHICNCRKSSFCELAVKLQLLSEFYLLGQVHLERLYGSSHLELYSLAAHALQVTTSHWVPIFIEGSDKGLKLRVHLHVLV
jgi:hypothetical protein